MDIPHINVRISGRWLEYELMDRRHLQTRYHNRVMRGGSSFLLHRLKKDQMIRLLLETEFGKDEVKAYDADVIVWRESERLFNSK